MQIAICEDIEKDAVHLAAYLEKYKECYGLDYKIVQFSCGEELLQNFEQNWFDIVFLDIYMNEKNGIETAIELRNKGYQDKIIFTTSSVDHAIESYEINATHYLIKPITYQQVESALERCKNLFIFEERCIELVSERINRRIKIIDIVYFEVYGNRTICHTTLEEIQTYASLEDIMKKLPEEDFIRCHRSYIVNINYIDELSNTEFILKNNVKIPIRRGDRHLMRQLYAESLFNKARRKMRC